MSGGVSMNGQSEKAGLKNVTLLPMESATSFIGRFAASQRAASTSDYCLDRGLNYKHLQLGQSHAIVAVARWSSVDPERLQHQATTNSMAMHCRLPWMLLSVRTCPYHGLAIIRLPLPEQQKSLQDFVWHVVPMKLQIVSGDFDVAVTQSRC
jgi:hypothetical protein